MTVLGRTYMEDMAMAVEFKNQKEALGSITLIRYNRR